MEHHLNEPAKKNFGCVNDNNLPDVFSGLAEIDNVRWLLMCK